MQHKSYMVNTPAKAYISLGSNLGNRTAALKSAVTVLQREGLGITRVSCVYETAPVECADETPLFLNAVIEGEWDGTAEELLHTALAVEKEYGRTRSEKNAPRTLDIDILLYGNETCDTADVTIPHPRMHERLFVLAPLCELAGEETHPAMEKTYKELRDMCRTVTHQSVALYAPPSALTESHNL